MNKIPKKTTQEINVLRDTLKLSGIGEVEKKTILNLIQKLNQTEGGPILKSDLARQYGISIRSLTRRIHDNSALKLELYEKFQYTKWRKLLMPEEVNCIYRYLGTPPIAL